jgi:hypothetical protein
VKEEKEARTDGQDQSGYLNPTTRTTCGLRGPEPWVPCGYILMDIAILFKEDLRWIKYMATRNAYTLFASWIESFI